MLGAIIGDIIVSIYEWHNIKTKDFPLFRTNCFFTDDTVMTVATADALMNGGKKDNFIDAYKNSDLVTDRLLDMPELVVFEKNQPIFVILSLDKYSNLKQNEIIRSVYATDQSKKKLGNSHKTFLDNYLTPMGYQSQRLRNFVTKNTPQTHSD